jgi:hypothetical protein
LKNCLLSVDVAEISRLMLSGVLVRDNLSRGSRTKDVVESMKLHEELTNVRYGQKIDFWPVPIRTNV